MDMKKQAPLNPYFSLLFPGLKKVQGISDAHRMDFDYADKQLREKSASFWEKKGEQMALKLFRDMVKRVPAYKDFLTKNGVNISKVKTIEDFKKLPLMDKANYMRQYPLEDICWDGTLESNTLFSVSSGSSGKPFLWPRGDGLELQTSLYHGLIMSKLFQAEKKRTLFIDSFSMGIYIAGVVTLNSVLRTSESGLPITIITPGVEIEDALRVIEELAPHFDQTIIAGYPPFVKDIIDGGTRRRLEWKNFHVKFLFAAENFSEQFRDYLLRVVGEQDLLRSSFNIYGSAEASILAHETPISIYVRRASLKNNILFKELFGEATYTPTLAQFNPAYVFFEEQDGELLVTSYAGGIPLLRYNFHDSGKIISYQDMASTSELKKDAEFQRMQKTSWKLPYVQVFGKSDFTISFYGLKIYPENIKAALEDERIVHIVSGKFVMETKSSDKHVQGWVVCVELQEGVEPSQKLAQEITPIIIEIVQQKNLEYHRLHQAIGERADPTIELFKKGDEQYFSPRSAKQRWTKKG